MRLFESILLLTLVVLIYRLVFAKDGDESPMHFLFFGLIVAVVHLMVEGYRWQMVPTYLSFGILYLRIKIGGLKFSRHFTKLAWGFWIIFTISIPLAVPVFDLPEPTGTYAVGTRIFHWVDSSRTEWFTPENENDVRELVVQVWYPAESIAGKPIPYIDNLKLRSKALGGAGDIPGFLVEHIDLVKTHSYLNAPAVADQFPFMIMSHGITGFRQFHTALIEELASHGYIIAAPDHSYDCSLSVFPDGHIADYRSDITGHSDSVQIRRQQLNTRVADIRFILDKAFENKVLRAFLDQNNIGVLGHSYGGATSIQTAYDDNRFKAALTLDSWMNPVPEHIIAEGIDQPFLYLGRPRWDDSDYPNSPSRLVRFMQNLKGTGFHYILQGSRHLDFSDAPLFSPISGYLLETGSISSSLAVSLTNAVVLSFFDKHLKNKPNQFPKNLEIYPELLNK